MAIIKYIGRTTYFQGKRLFDILCRLKNFGIGRIVYRNHEIESYPELSYYVICNVDPDMSDPTQVDSDVCVRSYAHAKRIFRGELQGETKIKTTFKADWRLVPRDDEDRFTSVLCKRESKTLPSSVPFPPLLEHMIVAEKSRAGQSLGQTPTLPLVFRKGSHSLLNSREVFNKSV